MFFAASAAPTPPPPRASPTLVAPASWKSSRRLIPLWDCLYMSSSLQRLPNLRERLGECIYALADLTALIFGYVSVGHPAVFVAVGGERFVDGIETLIDLSDKVWVSLFKHRLERLERRLGAFHVGL